jgi:hypothetical protein
MEVGIGAILNSGEERTTVRYPSFNALVGFDLRQGIGAFVQGEHLVGQAGRAVTDWAVGFRFGGKPGAGGALGLLLLAAWGESIRSDN